jgi:hypothetical protein
VLVACAGLLLIEPASAVTIDWVTVGDPGNPANRYGQGDVPYVYRIGKYDVTVNQYVELLNRKDPTGANTLGLFGPEMSDATYGGISFNAGAADGIKYEVIAGRGNHPVNYVSFFDAARFANWLNNGQADGDTESGAYTLLGGTPIPSNSMEVTRNPGAQVFIPSQDEWIKAGHFLPGVNIYFEYPTSSNTPPTSSPPTNVVNRANFLPNGPGNLTDVGAYTRTTSPYGAYDMAGNVIQWTDTCEGCSPDPFPKRNVKGISFAEADVSPASLSLFRAGRRCHGFASDRWLPRRQRYSGADDICVARPGNCFDGWMRVPPKIEHRTEIWDQVRQMQCFICPFLRSYSDMQHLAVPNGSAAGPCPNARMGQTIRHWPDSRFCRRYLDGRHRKRVRRGYLWDPRASSRRRWPNGKR